MLSWFERRLDPYPSAEPVEPPRGLLAFCLHYTQGALGWLGAMAVLAASIAIIEITMFGFLANIIDWFGTVERETFFETEGTKLALMALVVLVALPLLDLLFSLISHQTLLGNLPQRMRWMAHRYLLRQSMSYFQDEFAGRIAAKLMQTSLAVREVAMKLLDILVYVVVYFIGAVVLAAMNDWRLAVPFLVWVAIYALLLRYFVPRLSHISELQADARSMMTGRVVDSYTNISTVKLFSHSNREEKFARDAMDEFLMTVHKQMRLSTVLNSSITVLNMLLLFVLAILGMYLWQQSMVSAGAVAVALALVLRFEGMSHWIMWEMSALFENIGTVRDGMNSLAQPQLVTDAPDAKPLGTVQGEIRFEAATFNYAAVIKKVLADNVADNDDAAGRASIIIDDLNLNIKAGEKIGLVGRSGAGKSTLVNLLLRFYDLESGRITIDGHDISKVTQNSLRGKIGVVTQDTSLLHRSVRDNITYGRPDATDEEMIVAAKLAEADEFIHDLADAKGRRGYDAHVGERGVKLSGGQRQRIAIARVLLKDAPILMLDEATSALDSEVEAAIQSQLQLLMQGKTVIAIAHRLSTIAAMDRLIILDAGKVVEQGTHAELLKLDGTYARLWARQSGGFLDLDEESTAAQ